MKCVECGARAAVLITVGNVDVEVTAGLCAEHFNHLRSEAQHIWNCL